MSGLPCMGLLVISIQVRSPPEELVEPPRVTLIYLDRLAPHYEPWGWGGTTQATTCRAKHASTPCCVGEFAALLQPRGEGYEERLLAITRPCEEIETGTRCLGETFPFLRATDSSLTAPTRREGAEMRKSRWLAGACIYVRTYQLGIS